jgi:hypothetical protein
MRDRVRSPGARGMKLLEETDFWLFFVILMLRKFWLCQLSDEVDRIATPNTIVCCSRRYRTRLHQQYWYHSSYTYEANGRRDTI